MSSDRETNPTSDDALAGYQDDFAAAEARVARSIEPGARAVVVAACVLLLLVSFVLPHTGAAKGWDVLAGDQTAINESIVITSRVFVWFALVFGVVLSALALITQRWSLAWIALAGTAVSSAAGMLAIWSRQTVPPGHHGGGPGIGLILGWIVAIVLTFHWIRVVWGRTALQLQADAELQARRDGN